MWGRLSRWVRHALKLDRRYGVRYGGTGRADKLCWEKTGFYNQGEAERFLSERQVAGVVFYYDPIDLRMPHAETDAGRARQVT